MARLTYVLDTNVIADLIYQNPVVEKQFLEAVQESNTLIISQPVYYEVLRGLYKIKAMRKQTVLETQILPYLQIADTAQIDWVEAAQLWANATSQGRQLSDIDLLIAAIAKRLNAVIISSDDDFDYLPVQRINWRKL